MATTKTIPFPSTRARNKTAVLRADAADTICLAAVKAYIAAIETTIAVFDLAGTIEGVETAIHLTEEFEAETERNLIDSLLLKGESFHHDGYAYRVERDRSGTCSLIVDAL